LSVGSTVGVGKVVDGLDSEQPLSIAPAVSSVCLRDRKK